MKPLVLGGTGVVGSCIVNRLGELGYQSSALSRGTRPNTSNVNWIKGDLEKPDSVHVPPSHLIFCTVHPLLVLRCMDQLVSPLLKRLVLFTSSSINAKLESGTPDEQQSLRVLANGEISLINECERRGIGWTVLRPTIVYAEGRDANITRLSNVIRRFGFLPLSGNGSGLRQPVHAEDLAIGAIAAAFSPVSANKRYILPGKDIVTYHEMVGRIFDGMGYPRRIITTPPMLWNFAFAVLRPLFPNANAAMGSRMVKDMVFDGSSAECDFGWNPRPFRPQFRLE